MADAVFLVLLVLHVGSIIAWMGGATLFVSVLTPALRRMSPASRSEFILSVIPSYMRFIGGSSIVAAVAGLALHAYITPSAASRAPSTRGPLRLDDCRGQHLTLNSLYLIWTAPAREFADSLTTTSADDESFLRVIE